MALPEGCEYVPLVKKAAKQAKVGFVISGGRASLSTLFCHYVIEKLVHTRVHTTHCCWDMNRDLLWQQFSLCDMPGKKVLLWGHYVA